MFVVCGGLAWKCANTQRCVRETDFCTGRNGCGDGSTDSNCDGKFHTAILRNMHNTAFIKNFLLSPECFQGASLYTDTKICVLPDDICSGFNRSVNGIGDLNCHGKYRKARMLSCSVLHNIYFQNLVLVVCHQNAFHCRNNRCIRPELKCNGDDACGDGSSNENCTGKYCTPCTALSKRLYRVIQKVMYKTKSGIGDPILTRVWKSGVLKVRNAPVLN